MRNLKKVIATVLSVVLLAVSVPVSTPVTSYAAGAMDYTTATDLPLNEMQFITIPAKELKTDEDIWIWYKFQANPKSKIEVTATRLGGDVFFTTQIFDSKFHEVFYNELHNVSKVMQVTDDTTYYLRFKAYHGDEVQLSFMVEGEFTEPTAEPTAQPTVEPTLEPTAQPTVEPTLEPIVQPTANPTNAPTDGSDISDTDSDFWTDDDNTGSDVYDDGWEKLEQDCYHS